MSVQSNVQLYQTAEALGMIQGNNPTDVGSFIANDTGIQLGKFVSRSLTVVKAVTKATSLSPLLGVTSKTQSKVSKLGELIKSNTKAADAPFVFAEETPLPILRSGYIVVNSENAAPAYGNVYVRIDTANSTGSLGDVAALKSTDTDFVQESRATFIGETLAAGLVEIYIDLRLPASAGGVGANVWTTS